jgi:hypothetical protein
MIRYIALAALFSALVSHLSAADKIKINVRQSDTAIRQQLLQLTPLGTRADRVFEFLQNRLQRDSGTPIAGAPGQPFRSSMSVDLGHYCDPATVRQYFFPFPTIVDAAWLFDEHDRLNDIKVQRGVHGL